MEESEPRHRWLEVLVDHGDAEQGPTVEGAEQRSASGDEGFDELDEGGDAVGAVAVRIPRRDVFEAGGSRCEHAGFDRVLDVDTFGAVDVGDPPHLGDAEPDHFMANGHAVSSS
jgi:hypothetical protein